MDLPVGWHTENVGDTRFGLASSETVAEPFEPLVSQTKMANCTVVAGSTDVAPPSVCTLRQSVPLGGGGVLVGVGVGEGVGVVGVGVGDGAGDGVLFPPGEIGGVVGPAGEFPVGPGSGVLLGVTLPPPGVGLGTGGGGTLGAGDEPEPEEVALALALAPACGVPVSRCTAASRRTGWPAPDLPSGIAAVRTGAWAAAALAEHGFVACTTGVPCTPVRSMLTAPSESIAPVTRPNTGVKASRVLLIAALLPPSRGFVTVLAC